MRCSIILIIMMWRLRWEREVGWMLFVEKRAGDEEVGDEVEG